MLNEYKNLVPTEKEMKIQIFINELINELYNNEKIEVDSKKLLELLSYLTSNENISTQMKSATEYKNRRIVDILHKKEVEHLKKYIKEVIKEKDIQINSKNGTINALQCALKERTEERDRKDNIMARQRKQIDLIINFIYEIWCKYPGSISHELRLNGFNDDECGTCENTNRNCIECLKQYFERKAEQC